MTVGGLERARQLGHRGQVQVGEEDLARPHPRILLGDRLLHLEDQLGLGPHLLDRSPAVAPSRVYSSSRMLLPPPAPLLDDHAVPGLDERAHAGRRQRHALLAGLDLARHADDHVATCLPRRAPEEARQTTLEPRRHLTVTATIHRSRTPPWGCWPAPCAAARRDGRRSARPDGCAPGGRHLQMRGGLDRRGPRDVAAEQHPRPQQHALHERIPADRHPAVQLLTELFQVGERRVGHDGADARVLGGGEQRHRAAEREAEDAHRGRPARFQKVDHALEIATLAESERGGVALAGRRSSADRPAAWRTAAPARRPAAAGRPSRQDSREAGSAPARPPAG